MMICRNIYHTQRSYMRRITKLIFNVQLQFIGPIRAQKQMLLALLPSVVLLTAEIFRLLTA